MPYTEQQIELFYWKIKLRELIKKLCDESGIINVY